MGCVSLRASTGETSPTSGKIRAITSDLKCDCLWFPDKMLLPSSNWLCSGNNHGGFQEIIGTRCRINFLFLRRVDRDYIESQQTAPQSQCDLLSVWTVSLEKVKNSSKVIEFISKQTSGVVKWSIAH